MKKNHIIPILFILLSSILQAQDSTYNWSYGVSYDENGTIIGKSKQYVDELGRNTQSLTFNIDKNRVLAAQTVYDTYGRPVLNTLPAPIGVNMIYKDSFITDVNGNLYNHLNFDTATTLNNPDSVGNSLSNTLGYYYSNNGEEDYIATSAFPYSRMEYMADPTGRIKRSAAPGENFKMGSGHESRVFYMFTGGELDRAFGIDSSFYCQTDTADRLESRALSNTEIVADKTISVDAEGNIAITFTSDGLTIASCVSGKTPTPSVPEQSVTNTMLYAGTQSVDIHLPKAKSTSLKFLMPNYTIETSAGIMHGSVSPSEFLLKMMDLETNNLLDSGTHYTISITSSGPIFNPIAIVNITFLGTNKHRFLRLSYDYAPTKLTLFNTYNYPPPNINVQYKLDYSHFTANYYDLAGRLRKNVSPKGFDYSVNGKHTEFSKYDYDPFGQLIAKATPDEGLMEYLYSNEGVVRFSQNAQQRTDNKFSYVRYDEYNRSIESGEYDESSAVFEFAGYYDVALIGTDVKTELNNVDYDFNDSYCSNQNYIAYDLLATANEIPSGYSYKSSYPQHNLKARVSKTWNDYNQTWYSYDYAGRPTYTVQQLLDADFDADTTADVTIKTTNYTYTPLTSVLLKEEYQKNHSTEKLTHEYTYNDNQQLTQVIAKNYNNDTIGQAAFEYYTNGQLKRKELGGDMQGIDYVYTLHGQLKAINHPSLYDAYDPGQDGKTGSDNANFKADIFGMALDYYQDDYTRTGSNIISSVTSSANGYNNGLIKANRWRIKDENVLTKSASYDTLYTESAIDKELMYNYNYDEFYRFETATFGTFDNDAVSGAFTARNDFKVFGASANNGIDYDIIGNIKNLYRQGYEETAGPGLMMDSLSYAYNEGTSQLGTITDNSTSTYATDFETTTGTDFTYNNLGQMTASESDDVSAVTYYPNGQVKKVTFGNTNTAEYFYNERNIKIKSKFTDVGTTSVKYNWYITDASGALKSVHERTDTSSVSLTNQAVYGGGRLGMYDVISGMLNYELTDHLGNVRVTFYNEGDTALNVTSWADYYPFGEVLPGRNSNPTGMFGYQGQERVSNGTNEVAGSRWYNFNLRMYNPSLGRFNTIDPYSQFNSPYLAMANNPISFVDPDGGKAVMNDQAYAAQRKARREFKIWWGEHAKEFRHRGGENLFYHFSNLEVFGTSDFDKLDLSQKGIDGSVWSQPGWASVIKEVYGIQENDYADQAHGSAVSEAAMAQAEAKLTQWSNNMFIEYIKNGWKPKEYEKVDKKKKAKDEALIALNPDVKKISDKKTEITENSGFKEGTEQLNRILVNTQTKIKPNPHTEADIVEILDENGKEVLFSFNDGEPFTQAYSALKLMEDLYEDGILTTDPQIITLKTVGGSEGTSEFTHTIINGVVLDEVVRKLASPRFGGSRWITLIKVIFDD